MGMMSPIFRELNYSRINDLSTNTELSNSTIASVISDESKSEVSEQDVSGYLKLTRIASNKMLISKPTLDVLRGNGGPTPNLAS